MINVSFLSSKDTNAVLYRFHWCMDPNLIMHTKCMAVDGRLFLLGLVSERSCSCYMWHPVVCVLSLYVQVTGCCLCVVTVCTGDRLLSVCCHALYVCR